MKITPSKYKQGYLTPKEILKNHNNNIDPISKDFDKLFHSIFPDFSSSKKESIQSAFDEHAKSINVSSILEKRGTLSNKPNNDIKSFLERTSIHNESGFPRPTNKFEPSIKKNGFPKESPILGSRNESILKITPTRTLKEYSSPNPTSDPFDEEIFLSRISSIFDKSKVFSPKQSAPTFEEIKKMTERDTSVLNSPSRRKSLGFQKGSLDGEFFEIQKLQEKIETTLKEKPKRSREKTNLSLELEEINLNTSIMYEELKKKDTEKKNVIDVRKVQIEEKENDHLIPVDDNNQEEEEIKKIEEEERNRKKEEFERLSQVRHQEEDEEIKLEEERKKREEEELKEKKRKEKEKKEIKKKKEEEKKRKEEEKLRLRKQEEKRKAKIEKNKEEEREEERKREREEREKEEEKLRKEERRKVVIERKKKEEIEEEKKREREKEEREIEKEYRSKRELFTDDEKLSETPKRKRDEEDDYNRSLSPEMDYFQNQEIIENEPNQDMIQLINEKEIEEPEEQEEEPEEQEENPEEQDEKPKERKKSPQRKKKLIRKKKEKKDEDLEETIPFEESLSLKPKALIETKDSYIDPRVKEIKISQELPDFLQSIDQKLVPKDVEKISSPNKKRKKESKADNEFYAQETRTRRIKKPGNFWETKK